MLNVKSHNKVTDSEFNTAVLSEKQTGGKGLKWEGLKTPVQNKSNFRGGESYYIYKDYEDRTQWLRMCRKVNTACKKNILLHIFQLLKYIHVSQYNKMHLIYY